MRIGFRHTTNQMGRPPSPNRSYIGLPYLIIVRNGRLCNTGELYCLPATCLVSAFTVRHIYTKYRDFSNGKNQTIKKSKGDPFAPGRYIQYTTRKWAFAG